MEKLCRYEYDRFTESTRDERMKWWREARLGMFIHYGLFSQLEDGEWAQTTENLTPEEYAKYADTFAPKEGCAEEWCALAERMGAKYAVLTTRHHEGFSLWDSKVNPFNSVNYGPHRDIVKEFVDACRKHNLKIGLYSSLMDWHHPDGGACAYDTAARARFVDYIERLNIELFSHYGKIDILWYDMPWPMESSESWDSVNRNYKLRKLQPGLIINNRSKMPEDFATPEGVIREENRDWESCMTFNGISWGYIDSEQARQYSHSPGQIIKMLRNCVASGGNLLLNIGPKPDGSVPDEAVEPLKAVGNWLKQNGEAVYGIKPRYKGNTLGCSEGTLSKDGKSLYVWNYSWPKNGKMILGGFGNSPEKVSYLATGENIDFEFDNDKIMLNNLKTEVPDKTAGVTVLKLDFGEKPDLKFASHYPQLHYGEKI